MRTVQDLQLTLGQSAIEDIDLDVRSRDDIPAIPLGIHSPYCTEEPREKVSGLLESQVFGRSEGGTDRSEDEPGKFNPAVGRPGIQLGSIPVLGLLMHGLNCDYDRVTELANKHAGIQHFLGLSATLDEQVLSYRTVNWNVKMDRGAKRFERMIGQTVLAANVHRVGRILRDGERALKGGLLAA